MSAREPTELRRFRLGEFPLDGGGVLRDGVLTYRHWGRLNAEADNAILLPSYYTGSSDSYAGMIAPGRALDPERFFILAVDLFGNGCASSPSHAADPAARAAFPQVSIADNVRAQGRLAAALGVRRFALVHGWSMGAIQSWFWAAMYPDRVAAILPVCGAARCWPQNRVFLEGVRGALTADRLWQGGAYGSPPEAGLRAFGRAYCGWAFSPRFFRDELWRLQGHDSLEALLIAWEEDHLGWEAADLIAMLDTWATADIGCLGRNWETVLSGIRARAIVMPCDQDRYFTLEENVLEVQLVAGAELRVLHSPFGHSAGAPGRWPREISQIERAISDLTLD